MNTSPEQGGSGSDSALRIGQMLLLVPGIAYLAIFLVVSFSRMTYPFELEFNEGLTLDFAWRLWQGLPIYGEPSATFAPNFYPPAHYVLALPFFLLSGWELWGARLLSILLVLASFGLMALCVRRCGGSWFAAVMAATTPALLYPGTNYWYDLSRVDTPFAAVVVAGFVCLIGPDGRPGLKRLLIAAVLLSLSVAVKQTGVFACAGAVAYLLLVRDWRGAAILGATMGVLGLTGAGLLYAWSSGEIAIIFTAPKGHRIFLRTGMIDMALFAWTMLPLMAVGLYGAWMRIYDPPTRKFTIAASPQLLALAAFASQFAMGCIAITKVGGEINSSLPALFLTGLIVGLGIDGALERLRAIMPPLVAGVGFIVFALVAYPKDFDLWIPSQGDLKLANEVLADMRAMPGETLAYNHSFIGTLRHGTTRPYADTLMTCAGGYDAGPTFRSPDPDRYPADFLDLIRNRHFSAVYTNGNSIPGDVGHDLLFLNYRQVTLFGGPDAARRALRWQWPLPRLKWLPLPAGAQGAFPEGYRPNPALAARLAGS